MTDDLFGGILSSVDSLDKKYSQVVKSPVYEPSGHIPHILELVDNSKTQRLIKEIQASGVTEQEKAFLIEAAHRHSVFNYEVIADYYASATAEMQNLMENSALVIIDFKKAIQLGYTKLSIDVINQYINHSENGK